MCRVKCAIRKTKCCGVKKEGKIISRFFVFGVWGGAMKASFREKMTSDMNLEQSQGGLSIL